MADPRKTLVATPAGQQYISLVESRLAHDPKLQNELIVAAARLVADARGVFLSDGVADPVAPRPFPHSTDAVLDGLLAAAPGKENATVHASEPPVAVDVSEALVVMRDVNLANPR